jgi:hypothetical protein
VLLAVTKVPLTSVRALVIVNPQVWAGSASFTSALNETAMQILFSVVDTLGAMQIPAPALAAVAAAVINPD